jgi:hypothetical protein
MRFVVRVRWVVRVQDAGRLDSGAIEATEDAESRRPVRPGGTSSLC